MSDDLTFGILKGALRWARKNHLEMEFCHFYRDARARGRSPAEALWYAQREWDL
jgi:hypothetical protein